MRMVRPGVRQRPACASAASIARHQGVSPSRLRAAIFFCSMASEISGYFTAKVPPKHSTVLPDLMGTKLSPLNLTDQPAWFLSYADFAQQMAPRHDTLPFPWKHGTQAFDSQHMHEKFREFVGAGATLRPVRPAPGHPQTVPDKTPPHAGTRARGNNDVIGIGKQGGCAWPRSLAGWRKPH